MFSLSRKFDNLINYYKSSHIFEYSYINNKMNGTAILENIQCFDNSSDKK